MAARAVWKGFMRAAELTCPVSLYTAVSTSERIAFHLLNRATGHRIQRQYVDSETGKPVPHEDQVKGYELSSGDYVMLEPEEVASAVPDSDRTLGVFTFVRLEDVDDLYLDRPYYLAPSDAAGEEAYRLFVAGLKEKKVAALAHAVLFRRMRAVLIRAVDDYLVATTLNFDYEVRGPEDYFQDIGKHRIEGEMLELAEHIIDTKSGRYDPEAFDDRYEEALASLVKAKISGKPIPIRKPEPVAPVVDLMAALRESARMGRPSSRRTPQKRAAPSTRRSIHKRKRAS